MNLSRCIWFGLLKIKCENFYVLIGMYGPLTFTIIIKMVGFSCALCHFPVFSLEYFKIPMNVESNNYNTVFIDVIHKILTDKGTR